MKGLSEKEREKFRRMIEQQKKSFIKEHGYFDKDEFREWQFDNMEAERKMDSKIRTYYSKKERIEKWKQERLKEEQEVFRLDYKEGLNFEEIIQKTNLSKRRLTDILESDFYELRINWYSRSQEGFNKQVESWQGDGSYNDLGESQYCEACMSSPCICSDPSR